MEQKFNTSLKKLKPYFKGLGSKYEMEPNISSDDIYQICLEKLSNIVSSTELDVESNSFQAIVRRSTKNIVIDELRKFQTQGRDSTKEIREMESSEGDILSIFDIIADNRPENDSEAVTIYNDLVLKITKNLTSQERQLFNELTDPCSKSWDLLDLQIESGKKWTKPTYKMIASAMGLNVARMRHILYSLRDKVYESLVACPFCSSSNIKKELICNDKWMYGCENSNCSNNSLFIPRTAI